uniref:Uncharacterized protein n=1 Tax=Lepeophtheirus salmonis TaxID=72036 RepID=A0A0K2TI44_LEPSM
MVLSIIYGKVLKHSGQLVQRGHGPGKEDGQPTIMYILI